MLSKQYTVQIKSSENMKEKMMIGSSQHGFTKRKSCLSNLITFDGLHL